MFAVSQKKKFEVLSVWKISEIDKNFLKWNKTVVNIKVDVWEEKYDISFKDRSIFLKL